MVTVKNIIQAIASNYNYKFPYWNSKKIRDAVYSVHPSIADKLNYLNSDSLINSLINKTGTYLTDYIVESNYPVWVEPQNDIKPNPKNKNLVITYSTEINKKVLKNTSSLKIYANNIGADFVLLSGKTQGNVKLEYARIKKFIEAYDRTLFFKELEQVDDNLFDIVPTNKIGLYDKIKVLSFFLTDQFTAYIKQRYMLMKMESFSRFPMLSPVMLTPLNIESKTITSAYDNRLIVCSQQHADIFSPITFPFDDAYDVDKFWMELLIYRNGHEVFELYEKV